MSQRMLLVAIAGVYPTLAHATPRKILVLRLDGNVPTEVNRKLSSSLETAAKKLDGKVTSGTTTFHEAAAVVGCDPSSPDCARSVATTLGVDELVYGSITTDAGKTTIAISRASREGEPHERTAVIDPAREESLEPTMEPLLSDHDPAPAEPTPPPVAVTTSETTWDPLTRAYVITGAGVTVALAGVVVWSHQTSVRKFGSASDSSSGYEVAGALMVLSGLGVAGYGGWLIYRDHQSRSVTVTASPAPSGASVLLVGRW